MKANELRIGNYFHPVSEGHEIEIPLTEFVYTVGAVDKFGNVDVIEPGNLTSYRFTRYAGIPLTEEWLLKFGFDKIDKQRFQKRQHTAPANVVYEFMHCHYSGMADEAEFDYWIVNKDNKNILDWYTPLSFVHQLQNLYFALTGEELTIKP